MEQPQKPEGDGHPAEVLLDEVETKRQMVKSKHFQEYGQKMRFYQNLISGSKLDSLTQKLREVQIFVKDSHQEFLSSISLNIQQSTANKEVVVLHAEWGNFQTNITILNVQGKNIDHGQPISEGTYGQIYSRKYISSNIAVKCLSVGVKKDRCKAIKEWVIMKIGHALEFGPKLEPFFGFDIVMFEDCIEFAMQILQPCEGKVNFKMLYQSLSIMHKFHLVHLDIKPENIMLSPSFRKPVLIDFGLSKCLREKVGERSLTLFIGSVNFCSDEMSQIILSETPRYVDLYYHDLHCLEGSIRFFNSNKFSSMEEQNQPISKGYTAENEYRALFSLKFYLYSHKITEFFILWKQHLSGLQRNLYRRDLFQFFFQLMPTYELRQFFWKLVEGQDLEDQIIAKLRVYYEYGHKTQRLCSVDLLRDQEKLEYFTTLYLEYGLDLEGKEKEKLIYSQSISQLMSSQQLIKNKPYKDYVDIYLQYMSYLNNKYQTNSAKRQRAAKIYYSLFISAKIPAQKTGRQLVQQTIRHILDWGLSSPSSQGLRDNSLSFALFLFRIYDFFLILQINDIQYLMRSLDAMANHKDLQPPYRVTFILRVHYSLMLSAKRVILGGEEDMFSSIYAKKQWFNRNFSSASTPQQQILSFEYVKNGLPKPFLEQFGQEILQMASIEFFSSSSLNVYKLTEIYNQIINSSTHPRFSYLSLYLYNFFFNQRNIAICRKIISVLEDNLQDEQLFGEFYYHTELTHIFDLITVDTFGLAKVDSQLLEKRMKIFNLTFQKVHSKDILLVSQSLNELINKVNIISQTSRTQNLNTGNFKLLKEGLISKMFESTFDYLVFQIQNNRLHHISILPEQILSIIIFSKFLPPAYYDQIQQLLYSEAVNNQYECKHCKFVLLCTGKLNTLLKYLEEYIQQASATRSIVLDRFFTQTQSFQQLMETEPSLALPMLATFQIGLNYGQMLCIVSPQIQNKYHGISRYYNFALKYSRVDFYLKKQKENCFPIYFVLKLLRQTNYLSLLEFMIRLSQEVNISFIYKDAHSIVTYASTFMNDIEADQCQKIFYDLQSLHLRLCPDNPYIVILYIAIFNCSYSMRFQKRIIPTLGNLIQKLHTSFRRPLTIFIYLKFYENYTTKLLQLPFRKWKFVSNRLLKMLNNQQMTIYRLYRARTGRQKLHKDLFKEKIYKIGIYRVRLLSIRFII